jgi:AraC-like DNA-binding protein
MTAACLDRLMYRYHYGQLDIAHLKSFLAIITNKQLDKKVAAQSLEIFVTRSLIELKRTQQDFYVVMSDKTFIQDKNVINELKQRLVRHEDLVLLQKNNALSKVDSLAKYLPKESKVTTKKLTTLLDAYINDIQKTKQQLELIEKEFSNPEFNVNSLANVLTVNRATLYREFNKTYQISPSEYIKRCRLRKAMEMLVNKTESIKEIAYACGFASPEYFSTVFTAEFGTSPSRFNPDNH